MISFPDNDWGCLEIAGSRYGVMLSSRSVIVEVKPGKVTLPFVHSWCCVSVDRFF